jgi:hypothetical protein
MPGIHTAVHMYLFPSVKFSFLRTKVSLHQNYTSNRYMFELLCAIMRETEHKASLWNAIYKIKTRTMLLLLLIYYNKY